MYALLPKDLTDQNLFTRATEHNKDSWMNVPRFCISSNSISVKHVSEQWQSKNENLCAMELCLDFRFK